MAIGIRCHGNISVRQQHLTGNNQSEATRPLAGCSALIVAHNHPSGDPAPSAADIHVTRKLREAAKILEIELVDHVIVGEAKADPLGRGTFSFREAGLL